MPPDLLYFSKVAPLTWFDGVYAWRDRLVANPRFQRWAAGFPLTKPVARRRAKALFDLCAGFIYSQVLLACVRLNLFDVLAEGPQEVSGLAARFGLSEDATARLLNAATALRLTEMRGQGRYGLGELGAAMVGNHAVAAMVEHHSMLYADLADPVALLRGERSKTALGSYWPYAKAGQPATIDPDQVAPYTALMAASQAFIAADVLDAYPIGRHRCLLDLGGGNGTFLLAAAERAPALRVILFDLPPVAERARARFAESGLADRAEAVGGSFFDDPLPQGADAVSLVRVIHDHDDEAALAILKAARRALPDDGTLLLAEPMAETSGAETVGAYFTFYLLAMGSGRPRSPAVLTDMLRTAGFSTVKRMRTRRPLFTSLLVAKPS